MGLQVALLLTLASVAGVQPGPTRIPFTVPTTEIAVKAVVDGRERTLVLSTSSPASYMRDAPENPAQVAVAGLSLGSVQFGDAGDDVLRILGGDGALGALSLSSRAIGIDLSGRSLALWPEGRLDAKTAESWVGEGTSGVRRLPLARLPGGAYSVEATVGGEKVPLLLRLGLFSSSFEPRAKAQGVAVGTDGFALLSGFALAGKEMGPLVYVPTPEGTIDRQYVGTAGTLTLDAFGSNRVLVDFAAGALYIDDISDDGRLSIFLSRQVRIPLSVKGETIVLSPPPGHPGSRALAGFYGSEVTEMAGHTIDEWLKNLRGRDEASAKRLAESIGRTRTGFGMIVRKADGTEVPLNIHLPSR